MKSLKILPYNLPQEFNPFFYKYLNDCTPQDFHNLKTSSSFLGIVPDLQLNSGLMTLQILNTLFLELKYHVALVHSFHYYPV